MSRMSRMPAADPPPKRILDRPPSDRYASQRAGGEVAPNSVAAGAEREPGAAAPELQAAVIAIIGAAILVALGGVLGFITGQLFVSGVTGALVGLFIAGADRPRSWVRKAAVAIAIAVVLVGAVGSWLIGLAQGGDLGVLDFLWATSGVLVPAELVLAALAAWWGAGAGPISR